MSATACDDQVHHKYPLLLVFHLNEFRVSGSKIPEHGCLDSRAATKRSRGKQLFVLKAKVDSYFLKNG